MSWVRPRSGKTLVPPSGLPRSQPEIGGCSQAGGARLPHVR